MKSVSCLLTACALAAISCSSTPPSSGQGPASPAPSVDEQPEAEEGRSGDEQASDEQPAPPPDARAPGKEGADCGGMMGLSCAGDLFCLYSMEARCGAADQMGTCARPPEMCTRDYRPVCGCDDQTYSNACGAHSAGVSVANEGECESR